MPGQLFLASSISDVADAIGKQLNLPLSKRKLVFITTASEAEDDDKQWLQNDRNALTEAGFQVEDYTITGKKQSEVHEKLAQFDIICVGGGNTFYLLEKTLESGFDKEVKEWVRQGKPYIGSSAGSILAGPDIEPVKTLDNGLKAKNLKQFTAIGLTDIVIFPHWGSPFFKELYLNQRLEHAYKKGNKIILLTDDQYLHVTENTYEIIDIKKM